MWDHVPSVGKVLDLPVDVKGAPRRIPGESRSLEGTDSAPVGQLCHPSLLTSPGHSRDTPGSRDRLGRTQGTQGTVTLCSALPAWPAGETGAGVGMGGGDSAWGGDSVLGR